MPCLSIWIIAPGKVENNKQTWKHTLDHPRLSFGLMSFLSTRWTRWTRWWKHVSHLWKTWKYTMCFNLTYPLGIILLIYNQFLIAPQICSVKRATRSCNFCSKRLLALWKLKENPRVSANSWMKVRMSGQKKTPKKRPETWDSNGFFFNGKNDL